MRYLILLNSTYQFSQSTVEMILNGVISPIYSISLMSYLPGIILAISAHLFPCILWAWIKTNSSVSFQGLLRTIGSRWLCHLQRFILVRSHYLSRHCFPFLRELKTCAFKHSAINVHFLVPWFLTNSTIKLSSYIDKYDI